MTCSIILQNLGYSGDIGYQTFLYSSETDVRRVFVFLIEKLPKESEKNIVEPTGEGHSSYITVLEHVTEIKQKLL
jgi:hypothetical protein